MKQIADELASSPRPDDLSRTAVAHRAATVLRPPGALQRLDDVAVWLSGWQRTDTPHVDRPSLLIAAADHGVATHDVSAYPTHVTVAMVDAIRAGAATSTVLAESLGVMLRLLDVGVGTPTADIVTHDAMSTERFAIAFEAGREAVATLTTDLLLIGEMGIGNTTVAAAVSLALFGGEASDWVGSGTGLDDEGVARKCAAVQSAADRVGEVEPFEALRRLGGFELVALAGAVTEARSRSLPVVLDGFVTTASVAPLEVSVPGALDHCMASHRSPEPGHGLLLDRLAKPALLELDMRLGEGSGALIAVPIIRAATVAVTDVATFDEWGVR